MDATPDTTALLVNTICALKKLRGQDQKEIAALKTKNGEQKFKIDEVLLVIDDHNKENVNNQNEMFLLKSEIENLKLTNSLELDLLRDEIHMLRSVIAQNGEMQQTLINFEDQKAFLNTLYED
jgi:hypothetical protein